MLFIQEMIDQKLKDETYVITLDEYHEISTYWIGNHLKEDAVRCFDSFDVEHIPKELR